jgi:uridine phosphorylase
MLHFYQVDKISNPEIETAFIQHTQWHPNKAKPIVIANSKTLEKKLDSPEMHKGLTATAGGFYGPQGRVLRLPLQDRELNSKMDNFSFEGTTITNLEMETASIYGLAKLLGHNAVSLNAIIANRANGTFSNYPGRTVATLITYTLNKLTE